MEHKKIILFIINQLIILYVLNCNFKSVNCVVDDLNFESKLRSSTIAPSPLLVLPNPTTIGILTDTRNPSYRPSSIDGDSITVVNEDDVLGHESNPIILKLKPEQNDEYKMSSSDKSFIEQTLNKYKDQHSSKLDGDDHKLEHKSSKEGGEQFSVSEKGAKGTSTKDNHHKQHEDKGGKEHEDYDEDSHLDHHHKYNGGAANSKFNKNHRDNKRRTEIRFHNKYHKKEHHKLDDFFKNFNENGDYLNYGVKNSKKNKVYKNLKKGARKSKKRSESKVQKKALPQIIKLTVI